MTKSRAAMLVGYFDKYLKDDIDQVGELLTFEKLTPHSEYEGKNGGLSEEKRGRLDGFLQLKTCVVCS
jgi:hypothetical protein